MEDEKVKQLAETLKKQGLAASTYDAVEKAKTILNVSATKADSSQKKQQITSDLGTSDLGIKQDTKNPNKTEEKVEVQIKNEEEDRFSKPDYDIQKENLTVNELMEQIGILPEQLNEHKEDDINEETGKVKDVSSENLKEDFNEANAESKIEENFESGEIMSNAGLDQDMDMEGSETKISDEEVNRSEKTESKEENRFKEENKIDLSKLFNFKK